jgi:hypothetical protein
VIDTCVDNARGPAVRGGCGSLSVRPLDCAEQVDRVVIILGAVEGIVWQERAQLDELGPVTSAKWTRRDGGTGRRRGVLRPLMAQIPSPLPATSGWSDPNGVPAGARPPAGGSDGLHPLPPLLGGHRPVRGVEIHQRWDAVRRQDGRAELHLADECAQRRGDGATLVPPWDVHHHGHVTGSGRRRLLAHPRV